MVLKKKTPEELRLEDAKFFTTSKGLKRSQKFAISKDGCYVFMDKTYVHLPATALVKDQAHLELVLVDVARELGGRIDDFQLLENLSK